MSRPNEKHKPASASETRTYSAVRPLEVRTTADGSKQITGTAIVYNSRSVDLGGFTEIVSPQALTRTLKESPDVLAFRDHDQTLLLGRTTANTLKLTNTNNGLDFVITLPKTAIGDDTAENVRLRNLTGVSFGFVARNDSWAEDAKKTVTRTLLDVDLFEISVTSFPAYPATSVSTRSAPANIKRLLSMRTQSPMTTVDGVQLPATSFAYVGDPEKTDTWKLPIHFPGDVEKTIDYVKNALARFNQTEGIPDSEQAHVYAKIVGAAKAHGIQVTAEKLEDRDWDDDDGFEDDGCTDDEDDCQNGGEEDDEDEEDEEDYSRSAALALLSRRLRA